MKKNQQTTATVSTPAAVTPDAVDTQKGVDGAPEATETPAADAPTEAKKPKQFTAGILESDKQILKDLGIELSGTGRTGKVCEMPESAVIHIALEIATNHRFHKVSVPIVGSETGEMEEHTLCRFDELAAKYWENRTNTEESEESLEKQLEAIKAKLAAKIAAKNCTY